MSQTASQPVKPLLDHRPGDHPDTGPTVGSCLGIAPERFRPLDVRNMMKGSFVEVMAHELGHAIGVIGHTQDGGLMDPTGGDHLITVSVRNAIYQLYNECGPEGDARPKTSAPK